MMKIKRIKPMFTALVTTMERYADDQFMAGTTILDATKRQGGLKEYQKVLSVGDSVRGVKVGDLVCIDPKAYAVKKHEAGSLKDGIIADNPVVSYNFDVIELDGQQCLLLQERDITFVIEDYTEE